MSDAPLNTAYLGMGRPVVVDREVLESEGVQQSVIESLMGLQGLAAAMGYAGASEGDDNQRFQNLVATYDSGTMTWSLFAGRPDTPLNPDAVSVLSGGTAIIVELNNAVISALASILNFSTNFSVVDAGGGQVDIDVVGVTGGTVTEAFTTIAVAGQSDIVADSATDTLNFAASLGISITTVAGTDTATWAFRNGFGLEDDGTGAVRVKAHTLIDADTNGVSVDFTEGASYSGAADQYWRNNAGTFQWATLPSWAVVAGTYIDVSGQTVNVDLTEVADYSAGATQLLGHVTGTIAFDTVADWLKTLPGYNGSANQYLNNNNGTIQWVTAAEC